jgi:hypothetical protein
MFVEIAYPKGSIQTRKRGKKKKDNDFNSVKEFLRKSMALND